MTPTNPRDSAEPPNLASIDNDAERQERRPSSAADASAEASGKRSHARNDDAAESPESSKQPVKKMKRGKYISRACTSCQQRKIKCEGGEPCAQCVARNRPCISAPRGTKPNDQRSRTFSSSGQESVIGVANGISNIDLLSRLAEVERRLNMMPAAAQESIVGKTQTHLHSHSVITDDHSTPGAGYLQDVLESDGQTFAGEISMTPTFQGVDDGADTATGAGAMNAAFSAASPRQHTNAPGDKPRKVRAWFEAVLDQHGVVADEVEWRRYMQIFLDEIHVLYPILHPPTIWEIFSEIWEYSALWSLTSAVEREHKRMSVALVCFCLALGRCSVSARMTDANGVHSAGWTLYSVGITLMQDTVEMSNTASKSLLTLQILVMRVLYLFRLDATQRAARLLALSISNAHIIGLHRQTTLEKMPVFQSQMYCRTWWAIYVLDRRLAIESGRPYLIQDNNIDSALPLELGDEWLSRNQSNPKKTNELQPEIAVELSGSPVTSMPYLIAMVRFSRVVGKAWELLYGVRSSGQTSSAMIEYADTVLSNLLETLPAELSYDPQKVPEVQFRTRRRWQVKQTMLLFTCTTFLRLLMRRPFNSDKSSGCSEDDELESFTICASLAARILGAHESIQDDGLKHCFPFSHYLTSATMVMVGLITKEPGLKRRYRAITLAATRSLNMYCHSIWVSGKMMRYVSRLTSLAQRVLGDTPPNGRSQSSARDLDQEGQLDETQQLTPQSDTMDMAQGPTSRGGCPSLSEFALDAPQSLPGPERRGSTMSRNSDYNVQLAGRQHDKSHANGSSIWGPVTDDQRPQIPDWAMSDFNFESVITDDAAMGSNFSTESLSALPVDAIPGSMRGGTLEIDRDMDAAIFGTVGPNRLFDLDVDMEQAIMNLCNTGSAGF